MVICLPLCCRCRRVANDFAFLGGDAARAAWRYYAVACVSCAAGAALVDQQPTMHYWATEFLLTDAVARCFGFRRTMHGRSSLGAGRGRFTVFADWCAGMALFPYQIPADCFRFAGAPYLSICYVNRVGKKVAPLFMSPVAAMLNPTYNTQYQYVRQIFCGRPKIAERYQVRELSCHVLSRELATVSARSRCWRQVDKSCVISVARRCS